mmetsp:Transcript_13495/g.23693  ORF Transcript_13495/g.23693 Transcript_13495/m.23693 type:complete len:91 (+) Transcript_13495:427-699(+)
MFRSMKPTSFLSSTSERLRETELPNLDRPDYTGHLSRGTCRFADDLLLLQVSMGAKLLIMPWALQVQARAIQSRCHGLCVPGACLCFPDQ